jgi:hypothetical protein
MGQITGVTTPVGLTGGVRQSLLNILTQVNEVNTAMVSNLKTSTAIAQNHNWVSDRIGLPATVAACCNPMGSTSVATAITTGTDSDGVKSMIQSYNLTQIIKKDFNLSRTAIDTHYAGVADLIQMYKTKTLKWMANGLELSICQGALASDPAGAGNQMQGIINWAKAGAVYTGATQTVTAANFAVPATAEAGVKAVMQSLWGKGIQPDFLYCSPTRKGQIDLFTSNVVKNLYLENKSDQKIVLPAMISVYQSSFGVIRLFFSTAMPDTDVVIGKMDEMAIAYLNNGQPKIVPLGIVGDGFGFMGVMEATLEVRDEVSLGIVTGIS